MIDRLGMGWAFLILGTGTGWGAWGLQTNAPHGVAGATPARLKLNHPFTLVWRGTMFTQGAASGLFVCRPHSSIASPTYCYELAVDGNPAKLECFTNDGTNAQSVVASTGTAADTPTPGVEFQAAMTLGPPVTNGQLMALYHGATPIGGQWLPYANVYYGADSVLGFGEPAPGAAGTATIVHRLAYIYNRVLLTDELGWLDRQPYAFLEPVLSTRYVFPTAWRPVVRRTISGRVGSRGAQ